MDETIADVTKRLYDDYLDIDVCDTEVDMCVAFVYDPTNSRSDPYNRFIDLLAKHVKVVTIRPHSLVCDFSGFYEPHNEQIYEWLKKDTTCHIDKDTAYYDLAEITSLLVAGYCTDTTYRELYKILL